MTKHVRDLDYLSFKMNTNTLKATIFKIDFEVMTTYVEVEKVETVESTSAFKSLNRRFRQLARLLFMSRVE